MRITTRSLFWTTIGLVLPMATIAADSTTQVLKPPFGDADTVGAQEPVTILASVIQVLLGVVGAATLLIFIWGGFKIIFANGNEEKITKGKTTLLWAVIGLAVVLSSYAVLQFTFAVLANSTNVPATTTTATTPAT